MEILQKQRSQELIRKKNEELKIKEYKKRTYTSLNEALKSPEKVYNLKLYVSDYNIDDYNNFITQIYKFKNIEQLWLQFNINYSLSPEIYTLSKLRRLEINVSGGKLSLSSGISNLKNLTELYLDHEVLPIVEIGRLDNLQAYRANYSDTDLDFPAEILNLHNLEFLEVYGNSFHEIPNNIGHLKELRTLRLHSRIPLKLPYELRNLKKLKELSIGGGDFIDLHNCSPELTELVSLNIYSQNDLILPYEIFNIKRLEYLSINTPKTIRLPLSINHLENLYSFSLKGKLSSLPYDISSLNKLKYVSLINNNFEYLDGELRKLNNNILSLNLSENSLNKVPYNLTLFPYLTYLNLSNNNLSLNYEDYSVLSKLKNVKDLNLSENNIHTFNINTFKELNSLKHFSIYGNKLNIDNKLKVLTGFIPIDKMGLEERQNFIRRNINSHLYKSTINKFDKELNI